MPCTPSVPYDDHEESPERHSNNIKAAGKRFQKPAVQFSDEVFLSYCCDDFPTFGSYWLFRILRSKYLIYIKRQQTKTWSSGMGLVRKMQQASKKNIDSFRIVTIELWGVENNSSLIRKASTFSHAST
jgi:hypothetical protein